jgi:flagellar motor switch protein FliN/FliY
MSNEEREESLERLPTDSATEASSEGVPEEPEDDEELSWEDAMEDLEAQKRMIQENQPAVDESMAEGAAVPPATHLLKPEDGIHAPNLRFILDIPLQVTVELGRKRLLVHDLLQLHQGSVIELTKQIGEPFEVLVNQKLIARGEVVVINDKFGVRITDIISPSERVQQLQ